MKAYLWIFTLYNNSLIITFIYLLLYWNYICLSWLWIGSDIAAIANNWSYFRWHIKNLIFVWFACFSSILWLIWFIIICYEIRANGWSMIGKNMTSLIIVFSLDNIWSMNLDTCLDQVNIYVELNYESFTLLLLTNIIL